MPRKHNKKGQRDIAAENFAIATIAIRQHPLFAPLMFRADTIRNDRSLCSPDGWAVVTSSGVIHIHPSRRAEPEEWIYVLAHCLLHLGFGHFKKRSRPTEWNAACDYYVARFLTSLKLGRRPSEIHLPDGLSGRSEESLYDEFCESGIPDELRGPGIAGSACDMIFSTDRRESWRGPTKWEDLFAEGLSMAVSSAISVAAGRQQTLGAESSKFSFARRAKQWFISSYPLLGALASNFEIIEDPALCARLSISVAAVDMQSKEIFVNPQAALGEEECRFVIAHELLHVGLRHDSRRRGRDPYLWNVACDYVINGWLIEMGFGQLPSVGLLYDATIQKESAETIYDRIVTDLRRYRKLCTMRGFGLSDILERDHPDWRSGEGMSLDKFYRRCLSQGLLYHEEQGRGFLPAGLVEEIRALGQPPIPWDVELAQWFDEQFPPVEKRRSFARPSRRQSSTPDIPRPSWIAPPESSARTFAVVLDTSGSMDRNLLAKALGAIASYSISRDVPAVRVVFCDAQPYDQGYMPPESIADRVQVKGRGGTILQGGINLLEKAKDFPPDGPLLIITDGWCDRLNIRREHAFLIPEGASLPFVPTGKVFRIVKEKQS